MIFLREKMARLTRSPWWVWVAFIDIFLVTITTVKWYGLEFPAKGFLVRHFNLATERNTAVWFSGATLLFLSMLAFDLREKSRGLSRHAWWMLCAVFAFLSFDEIGSVHERFPGWPSLFILAVPLGLLAMTAVGILLKDQATRRTALYLIAGFLVLGSVAIQERLEHLIAWPEWSIGLRAGLEEGTELCGFFILLWGLIGRQNHSARLLELLPHPGRWAGFKPLLLWGLLLHSATSLILPSEIVFGQRGNPLLWYPQIVLFLLFAACIGESESPASVKKTVWVIMGFFFLMCSAGMNYDPPRFLGIGRVVPEAYLETLLYLCLVGSSCLFIATGPRFRHQDLRDISLMFGLTILHLFTPGYGLKFLTPGLLVFLCQDLVFRRIRFGGAVTLHPA